MISPVRIAGGLLILVLAGCSSVPTEQRRASDWSLDPEPPVASVSAEPETQQAIIPEPAPVARDVPPQPAETPNPVPVVKDPVVSVPVEGFVALNQWCRAQKVFGPSRVILNVESGPVYTVGKGTRALQLAPFSRIAKWQGMEIHLGHPVQISNGELAVHSLDLRKTVLPLVMPPTAAVAPGGKVIVLDPGHGGMDGGAKGVAGGLEKDLSLDWAMRTARLLSLEGWQVILTRTNDIDVALSNRLAIAEQCSATAFVSLHFNSAAPNRTQSGLETYCLTPAGLNSALTRGFADDSASAFPNNLWDDENLRLATAVHGELSRVTRMRDRGVRRARFLGVLRGQQRPAILVEGGYLSNVAEARQITDPKYRQRLAQAVAQGVAKWLNPPLGDLAAAEPKTVPRVSPTASRLQANP